MEQLDRGKYDALLSLLDGLSVASLRQVNRVVVGRIRVAQAETEFDEAQKYMVGDRVSFQSKRGSKVIAIVDSVNRRTLSVTEETIARNNRFPRKWRVGYSSVKKEE